VGEGERRFRGPKIGLSACERMKKTIELFRKQ